jgi:HEAT repeat protein
LSSPHTPLTWAALALGPALALVAGCTQPRPAPKPPPPLGTGRPTTTMARTPAPDEEQNRRRLRLASELDDPDGRVIYHAALELLAMRDRRAFQAVAERLRGTRLEQQRNIIDAIGRYPATVGAPNVPQSLVKDLIPVLAPFLGHPEPELRKAAVDAFAALDALEPNDTADDPVAQFIARILDAPRDKGPSVAERVSAVRVIARKPPTIAVPALITALDRITLADVRDAIRKELYRVTGRSFRSGADVRAWWEKNQDKTQDQWYQDRIERIEADATAAREAARREWKEKMAAIAGDPDRSYAALKDALLANEVPQIRTEAAKEILKTPRPEAYDVLVQALLAEQDVEVKRAILIDAVARQPPASAELRHRVAQKIVPLTNASEKDVRLAAVTALGELRSEVAVPALLERLVSKTPGDGEVQIAVLTALSRIGARAETPLDGDRTVGGELNRFLAQELARPPNDPLRDLRMTEQVAGTIGGIKYSDSSPEADRAVKLLVQIVQSTDTQDPRGSARARQVAVISLAALRRPAALRALTTALDDKDEQVAAEAARAIGAIAGGRLASDRDRAATLTALAAVLDSPRPTLKDAALDAIGEVLRATPQSLPLYRSVAEKLLQSKDYGRVVKLLKDLPARAPAEAPPAARQTLATLRAWLAEAYENAQPPDPKAALEIWRDLAQEDPERYSERYADELGALPSEKADEVYADLIRRRPADALHFWQARVALAKRFVDLDAQKARDLVDRMKHDPTLPGGVKADVMALDALLEGARQTPRASGGRETVPTAARGAEADTVPGGLRIPDKKRGP